VTKPDKALDRFASTITVGLASVQVRLLAPDGAPILGLKPEEVRIQIGGRAVPVVALDWYDSSVTPADAPDERVKLPPGEERRHSPHRVSGRGQLFVFFVEAAHEDRDAPLAPWAHLERLVGSLKDDASVAVVSLDDRLKLQQDFTRDRKAAYEAIVRGAQGGDPEAAAAADPRLALARSWDEARAEKVSTTERALLHTAFALEPLPGEKVVIFVSRGGIGRFAVQPGKHLNPRPSPELYGAVRAFHQARASLFVLEEPRPLATQAGASLHILADSTGGEYASILPSREAAVDRLVRETRGYYVLTFKMDQLGAGSGVEGLRVELPGRAGTVLASPFRVVKLGR